MRIIEVLNMIANGEIKKGTKIILNNDLFIFNGGVFGSGLYYLENCMFLKKRRFESGSRTYTAERKEIPTQTI